MQQAIGTDPGLEGVRPYTTNLAHGYHSDNSDLVGKATSPTRTLYTASLDPSKGCRILSACAPAESTYPTPIHTRRLAVPA